MKKIFALILASLLMLSLFACGQENTPSGSEGSTETTKETETTTEKETEPATETETETEKETETETETETEPAYESVKINLGGLKGPTTMGMVKLLADAAENKTANEYAFTIAGAADELTPKFVKGELDIIAAPANLGAVLYNKTSGGVQMIAVDTLGVLYIVEKGGETVNSLKDLAGKTVYATGKGSTPEYVLTYLLSENGLTIGTDVNVEWKSEPTEVVQLMAQEENSVAMLPQPYVTVAGTQLEGLRIAADLTVEWKALDNGSELVTAGIFVRKAFADEHPEAVAKFLEEYAASVEYVNANVDEAAALVEQFEIVKAPIAKKAIPYCNLVAFTGNEMKKMTEGYLGVLFAANEDSVGKALPGEDFYWINEK